MRDPFSRFAGCWLAGLAFLFSAGSAGAQEKITVAGAANLVFALESLTAEFNRTTPGIVVHPTVGASGSLFAQLKNGAPFDVFLSADTDYPRQVIAAGLGDAATLCTFATGRLVLWTMRDDLKLEDMSATVRNARVKKVAIAQPRTAPYGRAAQATLENFGLWGDAQPKLVLGESITQTAQFVETGNAEVGFVARSLVVSPRLARKGRWVEVPPALYASVSLDHAAVLTNRGAANPAARRYLEFLGSAAAKKILREHGYDVAP